MSTARQKTIIKAFRKQNFSLGPDAIQFVEDICITHAVEDDQLEVAIQYFVDEYAKQDDATMKVSLRILERIYEAFQASQDDSILGGHANLDPDLYLHFVDAFDMPPWHWVLEKNGFEKYPHPLTMSGDPEARILAARNRLHIIRQIILRNEHFTASAIPSRDRDTLLELRSTKDLLGRTGSEFLLFGMITHSKEGKLCLEDLDGKVELDTTLLEASGGPGEGLFTDGCLVLVEGCYTDDDILQVHVIGHPPCERRSVARSVHGHVDFVGKGAVTLLEEEQYALRLKEEHPQLAFFTFSDFWLDHPQTMTGLKAILESCIENAFVPKVFIFCGNFSSKGVVKSSGKDIQRYHESFDRLADLLASYPVVAKTSHFVLVPGPLDVTDSSPSIYPRKPLMPSFASRLKSKLPNVHLMSNPCRIMFCGQEIVVFRDDLMARVLRNCIMQKTEEGDVDLKKFLVQTIVDQCHLCPFTLQIQPRYWNFDHALRLYPMPSTRAVCKLVLADRYERYELTYEGCHVFNPGSFLGNACGFSTYFPSSGRSEASEVSPADTV